MKKAVELVYCLEARYGCYCRTGEPQAVELRWQSWWFVQAQVKGFGRQGSRGKGTLPTRGPEVQRVAR